jgi:hypothetical protein
MTSRPYEIWDWETANIIYAYATLEEVLNDVRNEVTANGPDSAASWFLQYDDRSNGHIIAEGDELVKQAFATSASAHR